MSVDELTQPQLKKPLEVPGRLLHLFLTQDPAAFESRLRFCQGCWGNSGKSNQRRDSSVLSAVSFAELWKKNQRYHSIPPFIPNRSRFCPTWETTQHWTHLGGLARTPVCCPMQITLPQFPYQQNEDVIMISYLLGTLWTVISVFISSSKMKCVT